MPRPSLAARLLSPRRLLGLACLTAAAAVPLAGCQGPSFSTMTAALPDWASFRSQSPDEDEEKDGALEEGTSLDTPLIGQYISFGGTHLIPVQGVGLVVGLDKTGEDPPPSHYRSQLVDEMRKRGVTNPNEWLKRPDTAMVIVRAFVPPIVRKGETFDVEVLLPGNSEATSLAGGHLLEARLTEQAVVGGGRVLEGDVLATAAGPVLTSTSESSAGATLRRGRVLGGAVSKGDRDLSIEIRNEFRSGRNAVRIGQVIGKRFHGHDKHGLKVPMAEPKNDRLVVLKVPALYHDNYPRYLQVVRNIAFRETDVAQRVRVQKLERQLSEPAKSELAALRLEGIGPSTAPILKRALKNADLEVRFNAAMALTYLGEPDGLATLAEAALKEPAFRVYACAALSASDDADASVQLRELLSAESTETRYGAFRALTVLNKQDPFVAGEEMKGVLKEDEKGGYSLHVLNVDGPPLVHMTHYSKAEVVLFGAGQELKLPAVLRAGRDILISAPPGSERVSISKYGKTGGDKQKTVSPRLADILRTLDEFGATYPDVAAMLAQADLQHNLPGGIAIDALPTGGRLYAPTGDDAGPKRTIGSEHTTPNIYAPPDDETARSIEEAAGKAAGKKLDAKTDSADEKKPTAEKAAAEKSMAETKTKKTDAAIRTAAAELSEPKPTADDEAVGLSGILPASAETDADDAPPPQGRLKPMPLDGGEEEAAEDAPPPSQGDDKDPWYDPRRYFGKPKWARGGPPGQWEPELE